MWVAAVLSITINLNLSWLDSVSIQWPKKRTVWRRWRVAIQCDSTMKTAAAIEVTTEEDPQHVVGGKDDGVDCDDDDNDTWWDCDPTLIPMEELIRDDILNDDSSDDDSSDDGSNVLPAEGNSVINDPSIYSFTQPLDMTSITPSIFNDTTENNVKKKQKENLEE